MSNSLKVVVLMGSPSDWDVMEKAFQVLKDFEIPSEMRILSAHRTPHEIQEYCRALRKKGVGVVIAGAGMAAHLAGVCASLTDLPVIGVPLEGSALNGLDSLLSTVQMPKGMPVATMGLGAHGAINAGLFAVQILALNDENLRKRFQSFREKQTAQVLQNKALQHRF